MDPTLLMIAGLVFAAVAMGLAGVRAAFARSGEEVLERVGRVVKQPVGFKATEKRSVCPWGLQGRA